MTAKFECHPSFAFDLMNHSIPTFWKTRLHIDICSVWMDLVWRGTHGVLPSVTFKCLITIPLWCLCVAYKAVNLTHMFPPTADASRGNKASNITNMAWTCLLHHRDYVVTFSTPLPDFRIEVMKGSGEYFATVYSLISHFGNHRALKSSPLGPIDASTFLKNGLELINNNSKNVFYPVHFIYFFYMKAF